MQTCSFDVDLQAFGPQRLKRVMSLVCDGEMLTPIETFSFRQSCVTMWTLWMTMWISLLLGKPYNGSIHSRITMKRKAPPSVSV